MKMKQIGLILIIFAGVLTMNSCADRRKITRHDTPSSGVAEIAVDETLASVIQLQVDAFEALNSEATIIPLYTSELEAYKQFINDSVRVIIGARDLTQSEKKIIENRKQRLRSQKLATDGIALIINKANLDSLISVRELEKIFTGEVINWKKLHPNSSLGDIEVVFDTPNSSIARYIKDSICSTKPFGPNVKALTEDEHISIHVGIEKTANERVIDYVSETPNAIGIIGVNWVSNPKDTMNLSFANNIRVMAVSSDEPATTKNSYKPYPYQLALGKYPLTRDIYIIITDVFGGLPSGFVHFSAGDQGQRIITKAGLLPATRPMRMVEWSKN